MESKLIEGKHVFKGGYLLPAMPGVCQECAVDHPPSHAHNKDSIFYQYKFYNEHAKWPTWTDAIAHCDEKMKAFWRSELAKKGIEA